MLQRTIILLVVFLLMGKLPAAAKENKDLMRAQYYYVHCAYYDAIPYYEKVAAEVNTSAVYAELGDCYYVTNNFNKASESYAKAAKMPACRPAVVLRYAQLLMQLMDYGEAEKWLKEYQKTYKDDVRVANLLAGCNAARVALDAIPPGVVKFLPFNTDGSDFGPAIWKGNLVFASDTAIDLKKKKDYWTGKSYYNLYSVPCDDRGNCKEEMKKLSETKKANIKYHDGPATFTADGKQMYFTRTKYNDNFLAKKTDPGKDSFVLLEIMIASDYDTAAKQFKTITPFQHNSDGYSAAHPSVSPSGKLLAFTSNMKKGQGGSDIYICKKVGSGWSRPQNAGKVINTEGEELFPYWADDETFCFSSDGHEGLGGLDIYQSKWDEKTSTFLKPENAGVPVNSSYDDISLAFSTSAKGTYLSSNRPAAKGGDNIYFFRKMKIFLQLNVVDSITREPLPEVQLSVSSVKDSKNMTIQGSYFAQLYPEVSYSLKAGKNGYSGSALLVYAVSDKDVDTIVRTVSLYKPPQVRKKDTMSYLDSLPVSFEHKVISPQLHQIYEIGHIYFSYNSSELTDTARWVLDSLVEYLVKRPNMRIEVRAHTDCRGSAAYNLKLSNERALSVVKYLIFKGISSKRLEHIGLGLNRAASECPDCGKCSEEQYYLHRVLEFKVLQL